MLQTFCALCKLLISPLKHFKSISKHFRRSIIGKPPFLWRFCHVDFLFQNFPRPDLTPNFQQSPYKNRVHMLFKSCSVSVQYAVCLYELKNIIQSLWARHSVRAKASVINASNILLFSSVLDNSFGAMNQIFLVVYSSYTPNDYEYIKLTTGCVKLFSRW